MLDKDKQTSSDQLDDESSFNEDDDFYYRKKRIKNRLGCIFVENDADLSLNKLASTQRREYGKDQ